MRPVRARTNERRVSIEPVVALMKLYEGSDWGSDRGVQGLTQADLADRLCVDRALVGKWFAAGSLPCTWADWLACRFGRLASDLDMWGDEFLAEPFSPAEASNAITQPNGADA